MKLFVFTALCVGCVSLQVASADLSITENFSTNPLTSSNWTLDGSNNGRFTWSAGALGLHLDSSNPSAQLIRPIGTTLTDADSFTLDVQFQLSVLSAPAGGAAQIAFGLVNSQLSGRPGLGQAYDGDRTGKLDSNFNYVSSDDTFNTVEFNYFPQLGDSSFPHGRTLTPTVFGAQEFGADAFSNMKSIFGAGSNLGDANEISALPENTLLDARLTYNSSSKAITLQMFTVGQGGALTELVTGVPSLTLNFDPGYGFAVDSLAILSYHDYFGDVNDPVIPATSSSLVADTTFSQIQLTSAAVPEPASTALLVGAGVAWFGWRRLGRRNG